MLIAMMVAGRCVIRRFQVPQTLSYTLSIGLIAIGLLFPAEIEGVVWVRGLSFQDLTADVFGVWGDADAGDAGWVSFPA